MTNRREWCALLSNESVLVCVLSVLTTAVYDTVLVNIDFYDSTESPPFFLVKNSEAMVENKFLVTLPRVWYLTTRANRKQGPEWALMRILNQC